MRLSADTAIAWLAGSVPSGVTLNRVYVGPDPLGLGGFQVAVGSSDTSPSRAALKELFTSRRGKTATQLVIAVEHDGLVSMFGPDPQALPIVLPTDQATRQLQSVLAEPDVLAATQRFAGFRKAADSTGVSGFTNSGLFATHHVTRNVPNRSDWKHLGEQAQPLLGLRGKKLIAALGFKAEAGPNGTMVLSSSGHPPRAVAVLLDDSEQFEARASRFQLSPVAFGLAVASKQRLPWLVVLRKDQIRLYPGRDGIGVGSKGQAETFFEIDLSTVDAEYAALLPLIFSAGALSENGMADVLLDESARFAAELSARLRERIYDEIVPPLAVEVANRLHAAAAVPLDADGLALSYRVTLRILFRLLFQAYAEDRGLLPSGRNEGFDANSLKATAQRLKNLGPDDFNESSTIWFDLVQVWSAIDHGNPQWQIPAYNGGLFSVDPERSPEGFLIKQIELPDRVLGPALKSMLLDTSADDVPGPVDFRSLSVREFGTVYEGLLESSLSLAPENLTINSSNAWVLAGDDDEVYAAAGTAYFHTSSGQRKATGSYFTPKIVVDHLIERSIVPILTTHLEKIARYLERGDAAAAARNFFDFRVADLAMGSGHFLVAAIDKIEALMRTFLTEHTVPGVNEELMRLAHVARSSLGTDDVAKSEVDDIGLLRRQIARRCIYGLDTNVMAVELARLAVWIHTFVPGLPMSNLDHCLVVGNSLTGIGTINEAVDSLVGTSESFSVPVDESAAVDGGLFEPEGSLFDGGAQRRPRENSYQQWLREVASDYLLEAAPLLADMARASEATKAEVDQAADLLSKARMAAEPAQRIFSAAVAVRLGDWSTSITRPEHVVRLTESLEPVEIIRDLNPAHMPYLFPEVFLRPDPGFDVLIGNPPWEKVRHEPQQFWVVRDPGLHSLPAAGRQERIETLRATRPLDRADEEKAINISERLTRYLSRSYRLQSSQHYDYAKLFAERNLDLVRSGGSIGLVLPQALLVLGGWKPIRQEMVSRHHLSVAPLRNIAGWAFENVDPRTTMCVIATTPGSGASVSAAAGNADQFVRNSRQEPLQLSLEDLGELSDDLNIPWFEDPRDPAIFSAMSKFARLGSGCGWISGRADSTRWDFSSSGRNSGDAVMSEGAQPQWRVSMTRHVAPFVMVPTAEGKWVADIDRLVTSKSGLLKTGGRVVVGKEHPALIYRFPTNNDNSRTLIAAALPAEGWLFSKGYAHGILVPQEASKVDVLALLGYLNSVPADWWARRFVDRHLGKRIVEGLPLPDWGSDVRVRVSELVEGILIQAGVTSIAGPRELNEQANHVDVAGATAEISALAFAGLGLTAGEATSVFGDFAHSAAALDQAERDAILMHLALLGVTT